MKKIMKSIMSAVFSISIIVAFATTGCAIDTTTLNATGFNVKDAGAKGDGSTDDTAAIQSTIDQYDSVYIPDGTYEINVDKPLKLKSNQTLTLGTYATLQAISTSSERSSVILIENINNVTVTGGQIIGERDTHRGVTGQWGMGINILNGASNINIKNIEISKCWGDGVYLGGKQSVTNISLDNIVCDNNRRQGLSITNANMVTISQCIFSNTNGTAPQCGIDIEPNTGNSVSEVVINRTQCYGNASGGIAINGDRGNIHDITISDSVCRDNINAGLAIQTMSGLLLKNVTTEYNKLGTYIKRDVSDAQIIGLEASHNKTSGVEIIGKNQTNGIENISFENSRIYNNSQVISNNDDGIVIDNFDTTGYLKGIYFSNCSFGDNQNIKTQRYAAMVGSARTVGIMTDIVFDHCVFDGNRKGNFTEKSKLTII